MLVVEVAAAIPIYRRHQPTTHNNQPSSSSSPLHVWFFASPAIAASAAGRRLGWMLFSRMEATRSQSAAVKPSSASRFFQGASASAEDFTTAAASETFAVSTGWVAGCVAAGPVVGPVVGVATGAAVGAVGAGVAATA